MSAKNPIARPHDAPRKTLDDVYRDRGLMRPTQFHKYIPRDEQDSWEMVTFKWGETTVRGFRKLAAQ